MLVSISSLIGYLTFCSFVQPIPTCYHRANDNCRSELFEYRNRNILRGAADALQYEIDNLKGGNNLRNNILFQFVPDLIA